MSHIDKFGHCVVCHKNMLVEKIIDQKVQKVFTNDYSETKFLLNDGSTMRVAICKECKKTDYKTKDIMKTVFNGWKNEIEENKTGFWTKEKKEKYIKDYSKKEIVCNADGIDSDILSKHLNEYEEKNGNHIKAEHV